MKSDRNRKVQLGARVNANARAVAAASAAAAKQSMNEWIEEAIYARAGTTEAPVADPLPGQVMIATDPEIEPGTVELRADGETIATITNVGQRFEPACRNRAYHWKQSPGNPCRFCGGEV